MPPSHWWNYFRKENNSAVCKLCTAVIKTSGNTTNLKIHIQRKHPDHEALKKPDKQGLPSTSTAKQSSDGSKTNELMVEAGKISQEPQAHGPLVRCVSNIKSLQGGSKDAQITNAIAHMIVKDNLPLNTTEKPGFVNFMKIVCPLYKLPSKKTMGKIIDGKYEVAKPLLELELQTVSYITLTCDAWTETLNTKGFLGITAHYLLHWKLRKVTLSTEELEESHTAAYLVEKLMKVLQDWNIPKEKVLAVVTDNASNISKAVKDEFGQDRHIGCVAHTLNLVATDVLDGMKNLLSVVKSIVTFFKQSLIAADGMRKIQAQEPMVLTLKNSVPTRWNSTYFMLERFTKLSHHVSSVLLTCPNSPRMVTANELEVIKEMLLLLKPLEEATRDICGDDYVTCSRVIPLINCLLLAIKKVTPTTNAVLSMKNVLLKKIEERLLKYEGHPLLGVATIMDPRFKTLHFSNAINQSRCIAALSEIVITSNSEMSGTAMASDSSEAEGDSIWEMHKEIKKQKREKTAASRDKETMPLDLKHYLAHDTTEIKSDPIAYWGQHNTSSLCPVALKYLSSVATSVPSERLFSKANLVMTELRNRLKPDRLKKILFLSSVDERLW